MKKTQYIETERLVLRLMTEADFERYLDYAMDPEVMKYIMPTGSIEEIKERFGGFLADWDGEEGKWMALSVVLKETQQLIGDVGFRYSSVDHEQIEIGYKFNRTYHGKGFGTEAMKALVSLIVKEWDFHKLVAFCDPRNEASFGIMRKLGMEKEGHFKEHYKFGDEWQDELAYGVLKSEIKIDW